MNVGFFTGTVKDLDLRHLDSGSQVCNLWLEVEAVSDSHPSFVQCISGWDTIAQEMADLSVGDQVSIETYIDTEVVDLPNGTHQKNLLATATRINPTSRVSFVGRAGSDPEVKRFKGKEDGEAQIVAKLSLAVDKRKRNDDTPSWFPLEFWGRTAEIVEDYVRKGSQIGVVGTVRIDTWKDKTTGEDRSRPVIRVSRLELLGSKQTDSAESEDAEPTAGMETEQPSEQAGQSNEKPQPEKVKAAKAAA